MLETPRDGSGAPAAPAGSAPPPAAAGPRPTRIERLLGCGVPLALLFDLSDPPPPAVAVDLDP